MKAGSYSDPAYQARFAIRAKDNHDVMWIFFSLVATLIGSLILYCLVRLLSQTLRVRPCVSYRLSHLITVSRYGRVSLLSGDCLMLTLRDSKIRMVSIRKAAGLPSVGHAGMVLLYVSINLILTFAHLDNKNMAVLSNLGSRTAWSVKPP